jgi:hypothetical protein
VCRTLRGTRFGFSAIHHEIRCDITLESRNGGHMHLPVDLSTKMLMGAIVVWERGHAITDNGSRGVEWGLLRLCVQLA